MALAPRGYSMVHPVPLDSWSLLQWRWVPPPHYCSLAASPKPRTALLPQRRPKRVEIGGREWMRGRMTCGPYYIFAFMWWLVCHISENHPSLLPKGIVLHGFNIWRSRYIHGFIVRDDTNKICPIFDGFDWTFPTPSSRSRPSFDDILVHWIQFTS